MMLQTTKGEGCTMSEAIAVGPPLASDRHTLGRGGMALLRRSLFLGAVIAGVPSTTAGAQEIKAETKKDTSETVEAAKNREQIEKNSRTIRFGLSVGWRHNGADKESLVRDLGIDPATGKVAIERIDRGAYVLSGVVAAYPWRHKELQPGEKKQEDPATKNRFASRIGRAMALWHWGTIANLNLASFTQDAISTFNRSIEGGLGVSYKMNEEFSLGITAERIFGRRPRSFVVNGAVVRDQKGDTLYALDPSDDRYYRDDHMSAISVKFVYFFK